VRSTKTTSTAITAPVIHSEPDGMSCVGWRRPKTPGRSPLRAIAYATRETPSTEVSSTLAVASIPPADTALTAARLPVTWIASVNGEPEAASLEAPTRPTATSPTDT